MAKGEPNDLGRQGYNHTAEQQPDAGFLESGKEDRPRMDPGQAEAAKPSDVMRAMAPSGIRPKSG